MKATIPAFALVVLLSHSQSVLATAWMEITRSNSSVIYVDTESLTRAGPDIEVWAKYVNSEPQEVEGTNPKRFSRSAKILWSFNCQKRTAAAVRSIEYADLDGTEVIRSLSGPPQPSEIRAGSVNDTISAKLCELSRTSASAKPAEPPTVLVCPVADGDGKTKFDFTVNLDYRASTANGWPAEISDARVFWASDTNVYSINRYTGSITFGTKSFPALFNGQCERKTQKLF